MPSFPTYQHANTTCHVNHPVYITCIRLSTNPSRDAGVLAEVIKVSNLTIIYCNLRYYDITYYNVLSYDMK